jgi:hypothetical protein
LILIPVSLFTHFSSPSSLSHLPITAITRDVGHHWGPQIGPFLPGWGGIPAISGAFCAPLSLPHGLNYDSKRVSQSHPSRSPVNWLQTPSNHPQSARIPPKTTWNLVSPPHGLLDRRLGRRQLHADRLAQAILFSGFLLSLPQSVSKLLG